MVRELDEPTRPRASRGIALTAAQQQPGLHLRAIHHHFRSQLAAVADAVAEVRRGEGSLGDVREAVHDLALRRTYEELGSFCGQLCRFVTMHHTIEDRAMFPAVAAMPGYAPVVARLLDEHHVIHEHLVALDEVVVRMDADPDLLAELDDSVASLARVLESHFTYEEEEMAEPLGLLGLPI